ncbi:PQQ-binding-like beta-propeller repeat protein [Kitasatospora sp. NPDC127111]|uniref:protein kinase domain-containing protein n=1 Tax=Kitasatospora sp. NPDC127111 TaxID=3345363 RepID=UPI0036299EFA
MRPLTGQDPLLLGGYRLLARLGQGGMGRVYLAEDRQGALSALKVVHPEHAHDAEFRRRFGREVRLAARVTGPGVAAVTGADPDAETPWLASEFVPGPTLGEAIARHGRLTAEACRALAAQTARALAAVHAAGLVHRDLKPSNVILGADGACLIDFGIALSADESAITHTGQLPGTPGYIAPEVLLGAAAGSAADVFALGALLAFAAQGRHPFGIGPATAVLARPLATEPDLSGVGDPTLAALLRRALAREPAARPLPAEFTALARAGAADGGSWIPLTLRDDIGRRAHEATTVTAPRRAGRPTEPAPPPPRPWAQVAPTEEATGPVPTGGRSTPPPRLGRRTVVKASLAVAAAAAGGTVAVRALRETPEEKAARQQREAEAAVLAARTVWKVQDAGGYSPAADQNNVYVPGLDGRLRALRLSDGHELWRTGRDYEAPSSPVVLAGGVAAVFGMHNTIRAVSADTGQELWTQTAAGDSLFGAGDRLFFQTYQDVRCVSPADGKTLWSVRPPGDIDSRDRVYHGDGALAFLTSANVLTGRLLVDDAEPWRRPVPYSATVLVAAGSVTAIGQKGLSVFDARTGSTQWTVDPVGPPFGQPAVGGSVLYLSDTERLLALDTAQHKRLWSVDQAAFTIKCVTADTVYGWGRGGDLVAVAAADGAQRWRISAETLGRDYGGYDSSLTVVGDLLYINAGIRIGCFDAASGQQRWTVRFHSMRDPLPAGEVLIGSVPTKDSASGDLYALKR